MPNTASTVAVDQATFEEPSHNCRYTGYEPNFSSYSAVWSGDERSCGAGGAPSGV